MRKISLRISNQINANHVIQLHVVNAKTRAIFAHSVLIQYSILSKKQENVLDFVMLKMGIILLTINAYVTQLSFLYT